MATAKQNLANRNSNKKTLDNYPTLTLDEIDIIIELVNKDRKFRKEQCNDGSIATRNNYRTIRAAYATVLLALADIDVTKSGHDENKLRNSALEKLQEIKPVELRVKISLDIDEDSSGNFICDLEDLLAEYAEPSHKYRLQF